jgi:hypothetical protein
VPPSSFAVGDSLGLKIAYQTAGWGESDLEGRRRSAAGADVPLGVYCVWRQPDVAADNTTAYHGY